MRKLNALIQELNRRNVFKAALSFIVAAWVFLQAAALIFPILNFSEAVLKGAFILLIIGFPLWLIFAYFFEITPEGLRRTEDVAPDRVYNIYRQVVESPISWTDLAKICVNPWIYPNLIRDPRFVKEVKEDGRFVEFLEHYGFL